MILKRECQAFLVSYAVFMFVSGMVAERVDLRCFLSLGLLAAGISTALLGAAQLAGIHSLAYLLAVQANIF